MRGDPFLCTRSEPMERSQIKAAEVNNRTSYCDPSIPGCRTRGRAAQGDIPPTADVAARHLLSQSWSVETSARAIGRKGASARGGAFSQTGDLRCGVGEKPHRAPIAAALLSAWLGVFLPHAAVAYQKRLYATENICRMDSLLSGDECKYAFLNARAAVDEGAPRFSKREECEKYFHHCMIAGFHGAGVEFGPSLKAVEVTARTSEDKIARPVLEAELPAVTLSSRSALRLDAGISSTAKKKVQDSWQGWLRAQTASPRDMKDIISGPSDVRDINEPNFDARPVEDKTKVFPGDAERERRRREEIKNAPFVQ